MQGLRTHGHGAGAVLRDYEAALFSRAHRASRAAAHDLSRPLALHTARVAPDWVDFNNHMTESRYLQVFGDATDALLRLVGVDREYMAAGRSFYTVETHLRHLREVAGGEPIAVTTRVLGGDGKRLHLFHTMFHGGSRVTSDGGGELDGSGGDDPLATAEHLLLHVDTTARRAAPAAPEVMAPAPGNRRRPGAPRPSGGRRPSHRRARAAPAEQTDRIRGRTGAERGATCHDAVGRKADMT